MTNNPTHLQTDIYYRGYRLCRTATEVIIYHGPDRIDTAENDNAAKAKIDGFMIADDGR